ncbi:hypothetical protein [Pseudooceanicola sp.]|nr:hypothetical protein [Pseudooceanicola sp.]MDF1855626.1 hypothetical protein [Pseudooceanicola sp.]
MSPNTTQPAQPQQQQGQQSSPTTQPGASTPQPQRYTDWAAI